MSKQKLIVGVTGYLGSGKSTALTYFEDNGFYTIDADKIVHELYEPGKDGWRKINDFFGEEYIGKNGKVNRKKLGKKVFKDPAKLRILEKLIHPLVFNEISKRVQTSGSDKIALEAVHFDDKRLKDLVTHMVWIETDVKTAYKRVTEKRSMTFDEYLAIVDFQRMPESIDHVVENEGKLDDFRNKIYSVIKKLVS